MKAWLKSLDLDTYAVTRAPLPETGGRWPLSPGVGLDSDGGRWRVDPRSAPRGAIVNARLVTHHTLAHGDALALDDRVAVFLETPEARHEALEARLDQEPADAAALGVWADWLLEQGDPLGQHLRAVELSPFVLEGLHPLVTRGQLELTWRAGLIDAAAFRCTEAGGWSGPVPLLRFLALRVARWTRSLTLDLSRWADDAPGSAEDQVTVALRALLTGPHLPRLEALSFGQLRPPRTASPLWARLQPRFPRLQPATSAERRAVLRLVTVPPDLDFVAPDLEDEQLVLRRGLWVGSSGTGSLRALAPGTQRPGLIDTFVIDEAAPHWRLRPLEPGVRLNGRPAFATRLLPGDVIEEPRGTRFRFELQ